MSFNSSGSALRPAQPAGGFTLVELIVAFAVATLIMAATPLAVMKVRDAVQYRSTVRNVMSELRLARNQSVLSGRPVAFEVNVGTRQFGTGSTGRPIPEGLGFDAVVAANEISTDGGARIRFFPDGSSTGGSVMIFRQPQGDGVRLRVDWLLGRVTQEPLDVSR
ncbi:GspH/FimT family pseudopilin [Aromatoleum anaerobium]|uniref:Type II secretion system protein H n=1 Tax=Aromatoleum anaerobium TaxID=182180 RepID=A0ABX1PKW8_9RHOO|nr:GspH/FimT family pseudopilin [Aromatoleum anaerobium]MCK0509363.1 GspH/FimT family pseudopilin [Aromatoleum anaerobium]